jgi:hypothetical protein
LLTERCTSSWSTLPSAFTLISTIVFAIGAAAAIAAGGRSAGCAAGAVELAHEVAARCDERGRGTHPNITDHSLRMADPSFLAHYRRTLSNEHLLATRLRPERGQLGVAQKESGVVAGLDGSSQEATDASSCPERTATSPAA